jgi:short-subunit dehydrogenase
MNRDMLGKHIVVVGASGVLGGCIAAHLVAAGAKVSAIVRDHTKLEQDHFFKYASADITDRAAIKTALNALAPFDGVINAAGVVAFGAITDLDDATLSTLFAVNAIAPIVLLRDSAVLLNQGGFFLNISGVVATQPIAGMAAYCASKAAAWAAMVASARELRRQQIDVIDARPPHTETGLAMRPIAGVAPTMQRGLDPDAVAARIVAALSAGERDLPADAFVA